MGRIKTWNCVFLAPGGGVLPMETGTPLSCGPQASVSMETTAGGPPIFWSLILQGLRKDTRSNQAVTLGLGRHSLTFISHPPSGCNQASLLQMGLASRVDGLVPLKHQKWTVCAREKIGHPPRGEGNLQRQEETGKVHCSGGLVYLSSYLANNSNAECNFSKAARTIRN